MTAGCARCGDCCESIYLFTSLDLKLWTTEALKATPDPATDDGWAYWREHGWSDDHRATAERWYNPDGLLRANADFITARWTAVGDERWTCDAFDPDSRTCTAHDTRPPVCRDYPWYGKEPTPEAAAEIHNLRCSYLADLPRDQRPDGARPLIPLTVITRSA